VVIIGALVTSDQRDPIQVNTTVVDGLCWIRHKRAFSVQLNHREGRQLVLTGRDIHRNGTSTEFAIAVPNPKSHAIDTIIGVNLGESA
jgi:hypothetical protein